MAGYAGATTSLNCTLCQAGSYSTGSGQGKSDVKSLNKFKIGLDLSEQTEISLFRLFCFVTWLPLADQLSQ